MLVAVQARSERQVPDLVRRVERCRRERLHVVHVHVVNAEALAGRYVEAAADPVHHQRAVDLAALVEGLLQLLRKVLVFALRNVLGTLGKGPAPLAVGFTHVFACITTSTCRRIAK